MKIRIKPSNKFEKKVKPEDIHGLFPYKHYLELYGNSLMGRYIVVVSNKQLNALDKIDYISIQRKNSDNKKYTTVRPNAFNGSTMEYKVKEVSILDVGDRPINVFETV